MSDKRQQDLVTQIDAMTWEGEAAVAPIGPKWSVGEWLGLVHEWGLTLRVPPISTIGGDGPYAGGHILLAEAWDDRLYFALPATAISALEKCLSPGEHAELLRRTPSLWEF